MRKPLCFMIGTLLLLAGCDTKTPQAPEPVIIEVEKIVEVEVLKIVEVEKIIQIPCPEPPIPNPPVAQKPDAISCGQFKNCTELKRVFPGGVNTARLLCAKDRNKLDRDNDGWACE